MKKIILIIFIFIIQIPTLSTADLTSVEKTIIRTYVRNFNAQLDEFKNECDSKIQELIKEVDECTESDEIDKLKEEIEILQGRLDKVEAAVENPQE